MVEQEPVYLSPTLSDGIGLLIDTRYVTQLQSLVLDLTAANTATSVDVERVFSKGRLVLSHVRNRLSVQSTRALLCLGAWSRMGLVKDKDILQAVRLPEIEGCEAELENNWDCIL